MQCFFSPANITVQPKNAYSLLHKGRQMLIKTKYKDEFGTWLETLYLDSFKDIKQQTTKCAQISQFLG